MLVRYDLPGLGLPYTLISQGVEAAAAARWLHISGQVGIGADGTLATGGLAQIEAAWRNVLAVLHAAGMGPEHLVKTTIYLVDRSHIPILREVRERVLGGRKPAATLVLVAGLAHPDWLVEIEAVAAA